MSLILLITTIIDLISLEIFILRFSRDFNRQSIKICATNFRLNKDNNRDK